MKHISPRYRKIFIASIILIWVFGGIYHFYSLNLPEPVESVRLSPKLSYTGKFSILVPKNWFIVDSSTGHRGDLEIVSQIYKPSSSSPSILVSKMNHYADNLNQVIEWGSKKTITMPGYQQIATFPLNTQYFRGHAYESTYELSDVWGKRTRRHCFDWFALVEDWGYLFSFCVNDDQWEEMRGLFFLMIQSIQAFE